MDPNPVDTISPRPFNARKAPKSRNGCLRCKAKRLKCDEGKPGCRNCFNKQCPCPGYKAKTLVWSTKHEKLLPPERTLEPTSPVIQQQASTLPDQEYLPIAISNNSNDILTDSRLDESQECPPSPATSHISEITINSRRNSNQFTDSLSAIRDQLNRSSVPEFLLHLPTMLVEYYFNYVCQIFSSFDGTLNPFRSTVGKLWDGSAPIYYAIQSMAAAYLANHFPRMSNVGIRMQRETYKCLYQSQAGVGSDDLDRTLLTVLLVGQTTAWHDPKDLGLVHLRTAKRLQKRRLLQQSAGGIVDGRVLRQNKFFEQCILYWDMLGGFVEDDIDDFDVHNDLPFVIGGIENNQNGQTNGQIFPHPWTGVEPKVQKLFAQVGRLIRKYRKVTAQEAATMEFISPEFVFSSEFPHELSASNDAVTRAQMIEEELLALQLPPITVLVDAGDENTPVQQYLYLAEAYQYAALLQIYRVFPSILLKRLPSSTAGIRQLEDPINLESQRLFETFPSLGTISTDDFLISLALHIISLLEKLPPNSGTRCLQPILVITAGSELRFPSQNAFYDPLSPFIDNSDLTTFNSLSSRELDIASGRRFVTTRLQEFQLSLPAKPIAKALMLVQETWARMDLGQSVYWMDVMDECGWNTIYG